MHAPRSIKTVTLTVLLPLLLAIRAAAQTYTITELPPLPGHFYSAGYGINNSGRVTGESRASGPGSGFRAVVWVDGVPQELQGGGITKSVGFAINQAGHVTGDSSPTIDNSNAFIWRGGAMEVLSSTPGFYILEAYDLNDLDQVVGSGGPTGGFRWQGGSFTALNLLPGDNVDARSYSINNSGEIAGSSRGPAGHRPVIWTGNTPVLLTFSTGEAYGINNQSEVVGYTGQIFPRSAMRPFYWSRTGGFQPLPLPDGASDGYALAINDKAEIIGNIDGRAAFWKKEAGGFRVFTVDELLPPDSGWRNLTFGGINDSGQITGDGLYLDQYRAFLLTPAPVLAACVDMNRDGKITFEGADRTMPAQPFKFWLNDDRDSSGEERDPATGSPDNSDLFIAHERDLEDFARLAIRLPDDMKTKIDDGYRLVLETTGTLAINLYKAVEMENETDYLTDEAAGQRQARFPHNLTVRQNALAASLEERNFTAGKALFLWEGKKPGVGLIRVKLLAPDDSEEASSEIHVSLRPAREFFEHVHATPVDGFDPPYETDGSVPVVSWEFANAQLVSNPTETPQCIVWVHGWRVPPWVRQNWAEMMFKRLWHAGYTGRFAAFSWFTYAREAGPVAQYLTYNPSEHRAWKAGVALDDYLRDLRDRLPDGYSLNLCAHSMGNVVAGEALRLGAPAENYVMMQAAISASCYDSRDELFVADFLAAEEKTPTPDEAAQFGYRGYLTGVEANIVNFYNEQDFALRTGKFGARNVSWAAKDVSWDANNESQKPVELRGSEQYAYFDEKPGIYRVKKKKPSVLLRQLTDIHESLAFLARSRTHAAGAEHRTGFDGDKSLGVIGSRINLELTFGFTRDRSEHSAQFNRSIQQQMVPFYRELQRSLDIVKP